MTTNLGTEPNNKTERNLPDITGISAAVYNSLHESGWKQNLSDRLLVENHTLLTTQIESQVKEIETQLARALSNKKEGNKEGNSDVGAASWLTRTENALRFKKAQLTVLSAWKIQNYDLYPESEANNVQRNLHSVIKRIINIVKNNINIGDDDLKYLQEVEQSL
jgi:hypothetical protein